MRSKTFASAVAVSALALASPALASPSEFRLPAERSQQQQPPSDLQGPVAPDVPASRRAPAVSVPAPSDKRDERPAAASAAPPVEVPAGLEATPPAPGSRQAVPFVPATVEAASAPPPERTALQRPRQANPVVAPTPQARGPAIAHRTQASPDGWWWFWLLGAVPLALLVLGIAGWAARRRFRRPIGQVAAPQIDRPRVAPSPVAPPILPADPLQVSLEPLQLALTLMNATLAYRLELTNRGSAALTGLAIGADMISAHASISRDEQMSGPRAGNGGGGTPVQRIERLEPGECRIVAGEFRLPLRQIVPIRQGNAALLLPLARFRLESEGAAPMVRTFVVGQPGQGDGLQPFRLDQGPRIFPRLAQHAFA